MEIRPFAGLRYDPSRVPVAQVVTQPYDKITPEMQQRYYRSNPNNLVRMILPNPQLEPAPAPDSYQGAAQHFRGWREQGILRADPEPSIYAYTQLFTAPPTGQELERRGFIALGRLYDYAERVVFRHELTHSGPKADRLNLLRATRAHAGQLFMIYNDPARAIDVLLSPSAAPDTDIRDEYGVQHRLWRISDPGIIADIVQQMADKKVIIADGHHRYETALAYGGECREKGDRRPANDFVMMTFVNMDSPGLVILPTHRVIFGLPGFDKDVLLRSAFPYFTVDRAPAADSAGLVTLLREAEGQGIAIAAVVGHEAFLLRPRAGAADSLLNSFSPRQRELDLVHLHKVILEHILGMSEESIRQLQNIAYVRDAAEAMNRVQSGANAAFLLNPVRIEQVRDIAFAGEVLPQKSTDFYPKLLSGLTIYALD
ncbi:MAG: DUF1015 domain-containing protein [Terriglobales bacterium]